MFSGDELDRYARHIVLPQIGGAGQAKLKLAHIAIVGAGGIGCPALQYLAAAGVGRLTIIDDDRVEVSNLQRQILFAEADIGALKAERAAAAALRINPHIAVEAHCAQLDLGNAQDMLQGADLILDGCDNFVTRLIVNDAALALRTGLLSAAIGAFDGQVALFEGWHDDQPCYACLVGSDPQRADTNCSEAGVLGALAGFIGAQVALEAIRALTGFGRALSGRLILTDMIERRWREIRIAKDPGCPKCSACRS